jgi:hypothetical protein
MMIDDFTKNFFHIKIIELEFKLNESKLLIKSQNELLNNFNAFLTQQNKLSKIN